MQPNMAEAEEAVETTAALLLLETLRAATP
jgi:hypothetical protein